MSTAAMKGHKDKRRRNARHSELKGMKTGKLSLETVRTYVERREEKSASTHRVRVNKLRASAMVERRGRKV